MATPASSIDHSEKISESAAFKAFRARVPKRRVPTGDKHWVVFEVNPKAEGDALVLLHGTSGTAAHFFRVLTILEKHDIRAISAQYPPCWSPREFCESLLLFLKAMGLKSAHFFGVSLGGYLALHFTSIYSDSVKSLILCNSFCDTNQFAQNSWCVASLAYLPDVYLKNYLMQSFPAESFYPNAIDFVVEQLDELNQDDMAARLTLNCLQSRVRELKFFDQRKITLIDTVDDIKLPPPMRERLYAFLPNAKVAHIKEGGDFPMIARPDDVTLHVVVHLRAHMARLDTAAVAADAAAPASNAATGVSDGSNVAGRAQPRWTLHVAADKPDLPASVFAHPTAIFDPEVSSSPAAAASAATSASSTPRPPNSRS